MKDSYIVYLIKKYRIGQLTAEELISILEQHLYGIID